MGALKQAGQHGRLYFIYPLCALLDVQDFTDPPQPSSQG